MYFGAVRPCGLKDVFCARYWGHTCFSGETTFTILSMSLYVAAGN